MADNNLSLEFTGYNITDEHPAFYKSKESKPKDFYIIHVYTPEHFTLLRYVEVAGMVTTHFSTINNKYELQDIIVKSAYESRKLKVITREEYSKFKNIYDNYIKSVHI